MLDEKPAVSIQLSAEPFAAPRIDVQTEIQKQDVMSLLASAFAQIRGSVTDEMVRNAIGEIQAMPLCEQYEAFELLFMITHNGHERGWAADVLDEISAAQWEAIHMGGS